MYCQNCGTKNKGDAKFCHQCGGELFKQNIQNLNKAKRKNKGKTIISTILAIVAIASFFVLEFVVYNGELKKFTVEQAREKFIEACDIYQKWYCNPNVDYNDYIYENGRTYYLVTGKICTKVALFDELTKYISSKDCEILFDECYVEKGNRIYFAEPLLDFKTGYKITYETLEKKEDFWQYKLERQYIESGKSFYAVPEVFELIYENSCWVFSGIRIFRCQYSDSVKKMYKDEPPIPLETYFIINNYFNDKYDNAVDCISMLEEIAEKTSKSRDDDWAPFYYKIIDAFEDEYPKRAVALATIDLYEYITAESIEENLDYPEDSALSYSFGIEFARQLVEIAYS